MVCGLKICSKSGWNWVRGKLYRINGKSGRMGRLGGV